MASPNGRGPVARSRYRQLRLTATQETSGRFSVRVSAKSLNADWRAHDTIVQCSVDCDPCEVSTYEDVLSALAVILDDLLLPRPNRP